MLKLQKKTKKVSKISLPKLGEVEFVHHRKCAGKIKSATASYSHGDGWQISVLVEEAPIQHKNTSQETIGIDLGVTKTIATSGDNEDYCLPTEQIKRIENRIAKLQKRKAKVEKFSDRWKHFGRVLSKLHSRIARIRKDFLHNENADKNAANNIRRLGLESLGRQPLETPFIAC